MSKVINISKSNNVTYTLTKSGSNIILTGSDGTSSSVNDDNTTYTLSSFGITATAAELNKLDGCVLTVNELNYLDGATSNIQTQLNNKQPTITGAASTVTSNNLSSNKVIISNASGKIAVSGITTTELEYLDGVTSNIQTQLNDLKNTPSGIKILLQSSQPSGLSKGDFWYQIV